MRALWNCGDISHSPANRKATKTKEQPKYHSEMRGQNLSCPLQKKKRTVPPQESRSNRSRFTSRDLKAKVVRLRVGLISIKLADCISAFPTDSETRPSLIAIRGGRDESEVEPNTADFRVDRHLWGHWAPKYMD